MCWVLCLSDKESNQDKQQITVDGQGKEFLVTTLSFYKLKARNEGEKYQDERVIYFISIPVFEENPIVSNSAIIQLDKIWPIPSN